MTPLTREFMRGKFGFLVGSAQAAGDLFESYLSETADSPEKRKCYDRVFATLKATKKTYEDLLRGLKEAV